MQPSIMSAMFSAAMLAGASSLDLPISLPSRPLFYGGEKLKQVRKAKKQNRTNKRKNRGK